MKLSKLSRSVLLGFFISEIDVRYQLTDISISSINCNLVTIKEDTSMLHKYFNFAQGQSFVVPGNLYNNITSAVVGVTVNRFSRSATDGFRVCCAQIIG